MSKLFNAKVKNKMFEMIKKEKATLKSSLFNIIIGTNQMRSKVLWYNR